MPLQTLAICVSLCESGVNPEALAAVVKELRKEGDALKVCIALQLNCCGITAVQAAHQSAT